MAKPTIIGHRGAMAYKPENTLISFQKAIELGVDMIELDVRLSKDNHPVIMHDESVYRTTNGKGFISNFTLKQIKKLRINKTEKVPTLEEAVKLIKGKCKINIHIKEHKAIDKVLEIINNNKIHKDVLISSFIEKTLKHIKNKDPRIKTGYLFRRPTPFYMNKSRCIAPTSQTYHKKDDKKSP
jgi:glycerophosphoryl diester phosphodiesterase